MKIKVIGSTGEYVCLGPGHCLEHRPGYVFDYALDCTDYDWLVVMDELPRRTVGTLTDGCERLCCPREHTILCTGEPTSIKSYSGAYVRQFGHLLTNRPPEAEHHPRRHLGRGYYPWFNGRTHRELSTLTLPEKTKCIAAICSAKRMRHTRHRDRFRLVEELQRQVPELDWYGKGVRPFARKCEVLDAYRYQIVAENHIGPHHWTEKLADAFLSECLPFYAGDPAIFEVFPEESMIPIPLDDPRAAAVIVKRAIADDEYARRRPAVLEAKRRILARYNFWDQVIAVIDASEGEMSGVPGGVLRSRRGLRRRCPSAALEDLWAHLRRFCR